jgi:hypothetical protein
MTEENPFYESEGEDVVPEYRADPDYETFIDKHDRQTRGKAIWVRCNGIHDTVVEIAMDFNAIAWIGGQQEIGERGQEHWQGMIIFENRLYNTGIDKILAKIFQNQRMAWGNLLTSKDISKMYYYIRKALTRDDRYTYAESDILPAIYGDQKQKEEKETNVAAAMELIAKHEGSMDAAMLEFLENGGSSTQWAEAKTRHCMIKQARSALKAKRDAGRQTLRPWQKHLTNILEAPASKRDIIVVLDTVGNCGKTWFQKHWTSLNPPRS